MVSGIYKGINGQPALLKAPADIKPRVLMTIVVMTPGQVEGYNKVSAVGVLRDSRHVGASVVSFGLL